MTSVAWFVVYKTHQTHQTHVHISTGKVADTGNVKLKPPAALDTQWHYT